MEAQMPSFRSDSEIFFHSLFLRIYLTKMRRRRNFTHAVFGVFSLFSLFFWLFVSFGVWFFLCVCIFFYYTKQRIELSKEKESPIILKVNALNLCIQRIELKFGAY